MGFKLMLRLGAVLAVLPALSACLNPARLAQAPIPQAWVATDPPGSTLVVVLPGRGDDLDGLRDAGIAEAIREAAPTVDILLAGATWPYYAAGGVADRLRDEVLLPARERGYRQIWLAGASMGGFGALLVQYSHPGLVDGLLLMAPYMGAGPLMREIADAGGLMAWEPGPVPAEVDRDTVFREIWRMVQGWGQSPDSAPPVWLLCGEEDRFMPAAQMVAAVLPESHFVQRAGGHAWVVWAPGAAEVVRRISAGGG